MRRICVPILLAALVAGPSVAQGSAARARVRIEFELPKRPWKTDRVAAEIDQVAKSTAVGVAEALDDWITFLDLRPDGPEFPVLVGRLVCRNPDEGTDCGAVLWEWELDLGDGPIVGDFSDWDYRPSEFFGEKVRKVPLSRLGRYITEDLEEKLEVDHQALVDQLLHEIQVLDRAVPTTDPDPNKGQLWHLPARSEDLGVGDKTVFRIRAEVEHLKQPYECLTQLRNFRPATAPSGFPLVTQILVRDRALEIDDQEDNDTCRTNHEDLVNDKLGHLLSQAVFVRRLERPAPGRSGPSSGGGRR